MRSTPNIPASRRPVVKTVLNRIRRALPMGNQHKVHFVYLVPSDKADIASTAIAKAAQDLQAWYRWRMSNGKTFTLCSPVVEVYHTPNPAIWYSTNNNGGSPNGWFWGNTLHDLRQFTGGGFNQEFDDWVVYIDAPLSAGQYVGGTSNGSFSGVCVLPEQDVRAIVGRDHQYSVCREIGGLGHEMGHSLGLHHPNGDPQFAQAIMGTGYLIYPSCILLQQHLDFLNTSPFFTERPQLPKSDLCPFDDGGRHLPRPRPRPTPAPRPI